MEKNTVQPLETGQQSADPTAHRETLQKYTATRYLERRGGLPPAAPAFECMTLKQTLTARETLLAMIQGRKEPQNAMMTNKGKPCDDLDIRKTCVMHLPHSMDRVRNQKNKKIQGKREFTRCHSSR